MKNIILILTAIIFLTSCASQSSKRTPEEIQAQTEQLKSSPSTWNAAPSVPFSGFGQFEFKPIELASALQSDEKKVNSAKEASRVITRRVNLLFDQWKQKNDSNRTLIIESTFTEYKIVSGGVRFLAGGLAGDSNVYIEMEIKDKSSGQILVSPNFYQRAHRLAGAWTFGSHDSSIPERLAVLVEKYFKDNYTALEGGPTGRDK